MVNFKPFRLIFAMRSPVVLAEHPPHLDALLAFALSAHLGEEVGANPGPELNKYLAKDEVSGVYRASALSFGVTPDQGLTAAAVTRVGRLNEGQLSSQWFKPNGKGGKAYTKIITAGGPTKTRFDTRAAFAAPYVVFDGVGCKAEIKELLEYYLMGIGTEGYSAGLGHFDKVHAVDLLSDSSWFREGRQARYLPSELVPDNNRKIKGRTEPPYWLKKNSIDIAPCERVMIIPIIETLI